MGWKKWLVAGLCLWVGSQVWASEWPLAELHQKLRLRVVSVAPLPKKKKKKKETFRERYWRRIRERRMNLFRGISATGIVWDRQGHVLTAAAVLPSHEQHVQVTFLDGTTFRAKVLVRDLVRGYGLLKLPRPYGAPIPLGRSSDVKVGEWVFSLGSPYDLILRVFQLAMSGGRISGKYWLTFEKYQGPILETDSAIDRGNFGGPLVTLEGRMVGLLFPGHSRLRYLGAAIPIDWLRKYLPERKDGKGLVSKPVSVQEWEKGWRKVWRGASSFVYPVYIPQEQKTGQKYWFRPKGYPFPALSLGEGFFLVAQSQLRLWSRQKERLELVVSPTHRLPLQWVAEHRGLGLVLFRTEQAFPPPPMGDSKALKEGTELLTIGVLPFQVGTKTVSWEKGTVHTFDWGILSSLYRFQGRFYQTSLRLNHANLGSGVFDASGRLVGVTVWPVRRTGQSSGVGLVVPVHVLQQVLGELKKGKSFPEFRPAYLGIALEGAPPKVVAVQQGSPAARAGVQVGDLLQSLHGRKVENPFHFRQILDTLSAGQKVQLTLLREGKVVTLTLTLSERPQKKHPLGGRLRQFPVPKRE